MKRNMDLIRQLLLCIERETSTQYDFGIEGVDEFEKWYNVDLLIQANFIRGVEVSWSSDGLGPSVYLKGLVSMTWQGHDFLDAVRDDTVWSEAKEQVSARGLDMQSLTFDVVKTLCVSTIEHMLGL